MAGFIKIYRDVLDSVLFTKPILLQMWLLLNKLARFTETEQDGIELHPGQVLTSNPALAQRCNLTERRVRYILDCLEDMQLITRENIRNRYTRITLTNPDELQCDKQTELPPPREVQEEKAPAPPEKEQKICCGMFGNVYLTIEEKKQLSQRWDEAEQYIDPFRHTSDVQARHILTILQCCVSGCSRMQAKRPKNSSRSLQQDQLPPLHQSRSWLIFRVRIPISTQHLHPMTWKGQSILHAQVYPFCENATERK